MKTKDSTARSDQTIKPRGSKNNGLISIQEETEASKVQEVKARPMMKEDSIPEPKKNELVDRNLKRAGNAKTTGSKRKPEKSIKPTDSS